MTKADVEKARQNKEQKRNMAEDAKNEYAQKLVKCNEQQKNHHTQLIPGKCTCIQQESIDCQVHGPTGRLVLVLTGLGPDTQYEFESS